LIEVFVCSKSPSLNIKKYREAASHIFCMPDLYPALVRDLESKFKGRILSEDDRTVLQQLKTLTKNLDDEQLKIYDVSRLSGRIKAIKYRIRKTPAVIADGRKYEGLKQILKLIEQTETRKE